MILDWLPLFLILLAYDLLRGHVHDLNARAHLQPQIDFDRWLFGGTVPMVSVALISATGYPLAPALYLAAAGAISFAVVLITNALPEEADGST